MSTGNEFIEIDLNPEETTVMVGRNGAGKCLKRSTKINIRISNPEIESLFWDFMNGHKDVTIGDISDFYEKYPQYLSLIDVETRFGFYPIEYAGITEYDSKVLNFILEDDIEIGSSPEHRFFQDDWIKAIDLDIGDWILTKYGPKKILDIKVSDQLEDLYDLQVKSVHEFYANDIVSHNSSFIEALIFGLYGKPHRKINKPQLVNSITNKNLLVEIEFDMGLDSFLVRRGMKPNIFEIHKNGALIEQSAHSKDYQEFLEKDILNSSLRTFTQVVVLGSATFTPFMQLTPPARREVIDNILELDTLTKMSILLKDRLQQAKSKVTDLDLKRSALDSKIKTIKDQAEKNSIDYTSLISSFEKDVSLTRERIQKTTIDMTALEELVSAVEDPTNKVNDLLKRIRSIEDSIFRLEVEMQPLSKELDFFKDNDDCIVCKQHIDLDFKSQRMSVLNKDLLLKNDSVSSLKEEKKALQGEAETASKILSHRKSLLSKIEEYRRLILKDTEYVSKTLLKIEELKESSLKTIERVDTMGLEKELTDLDQQRSKMMHQIDTLNTAGALLKDTGIKSLIVSEYVPIINGLVNKYLEDMDFFVQFELNESFEEMIRSRYRDVFSYASFSEGEKQRIDLALLFTWRSIAKRRNSLSTNLLILDEVFDSSLDSVSATLITNLIKDLAKDTNIFIISHHDEVADVFPRVLRFEKVKNFTRISS